MTKEFDARLKTAPDKSQLLILGAQVLFGALHFRGTFQDLFEQLPPGAKVVQCVGLLLLSLSVLGSLHRRT